MCDNIENTMIRYENAKVYKLIDDEGFYYYGSTCLPLYKRYHYHKCCAKTKTKRKIYSIFTYERFLNNEIKIDLIDSFALKTKEELIHQENLHIEQSLDDPKCLNTNRAIENYEVKKLKSKEYYESNTYVIKERRKKNYEANVDVLKERRKEYYGNCKDKIKQQMKEYYETNKNNIKQQMKEYYETNKDNIKGQRKEYYETNKDNIKEQKKEYYETNKDIIKEQKKEYYETNKDNIREKATKKETCICGSIFSCCNRAQHMKTNKHMSFVAANGNENESINLTDTR